jgi:NAD(P)-binding Rossmann-like domain
MRAPRRAQAAAALARRTGCDVAEAADMLARPDASSADSQSGPARLDAAVSRRQVLGGAAVAGLAEAVPAGVPSRPPAGRRAPLDPRVVIIGSGIAGLGCALRLWTRHGIRSQVFEYNACRSGGRIHTLRGYFDDGQYAEELGEFISSEHTAIASGTTGAGGSSTTPPS